MKVIKFSLKYTGKSTGGNLVRVRSRINTTRAPWSILNELERISATRHVFGSPGY